MKKYKIKFPLEFWETFRIFEKTSIYPKIYRGIVHGKPGEHKEDIIHRAMSQGIVHENDIVFIEHIYL